MNDGVIPLREMLDRSDDATVRRETEDQERALLYVAVTRARADVLVTGWGQGSGWLNAAETR